MYIGRYINGKIIAGTYPSENEVDKIKLKASINHSKASNTPV